MRFSVNHGESLYDFGVKSDEEKSVEGVPSVERPDCSDGAAVSEELEESEGAEVPEEPVVSDDSDDPEVSEDPEAPEDPEGVATAGGLITRFSSGVYVPRFEMPSP